MAKYGDEKGRKLGSDAGRQRIAERRARMEEVRGAKAGEEVESTDVAVAATELAGEEAAPKKTSARKRSR